MAKKYHIDAHGKVVPCQAFLRKCPRTDYSSQKAAYSDLYLQEEENRLAKARAEVKKVMNDPNSHSSFVGADFSGEGHSRNARVFAQEIDKEFFKTGEYPQKVYAAVNLNRASVDNRNTPISISLHRIPVADYDEGVIKGEWQLKTEFKHNKQQNSIVLDFENDYEHARNIAENTIRNVVISTSPRDFTNQQIQQETIHLITQLDEAYTQVEEEASGPYAVWEKDDETGSFAGSTMDHINVNVNYNTTLFRGRTFDRFLNAKGGYYTSVTPEMNIQVYDNENGMSESSWRIVHYEEEWYLQTVTEDGVPNPQKVADAEEAYNKMYDFVTTHMRTNTPQIAEEKARYVADLMVEVEQAIDKNDKIKRDQNERLFGKNE